MVRVAQLEVSQYFSLNGDIYKILRKRDKYAYLKVVCHHSKHPVLESICVTVKVTPLRPADIPPHRTHRGYYPLPRYMPKRKNARS